MMIIAVKVKTLWDLGQRFFPRMLSLFEGFRLNLKGTTYYDNHDDHSVLQSVYRELRPGDFSRGVLQKASGQTVVVPMKNVSWDDWGRPARIVQSLAKIGKEPIFDSNFSG